VFFPIHSAGVEGDERAVGATHRSVVEDGVAEVGHIVEGSAVLGEIVPFTEQARPPFSDICVPPLRVRRSDGAASRTY